MADFEQAGATERLRRVAILRDMQAKLKRSSAEALGVSASASAAEVRSAFMALTKQYHPAKFARLDEATVKLANEVFLQLREAYETLSGAAGSKRARTVPGTEDARSGEAARKPEGGRDGRDVRAADNAGASVAGATTGSTAGSTAGSTTSSAAGASMPGAGSPSGLGVNRQPLTSRPAIEGVAAGRVPASSSMISRAPLGSAAAPPRRTPPSTAATNAPRTSTSAAPGSTGSTSHAPIPNATSRAPLNSNAVVSSTGRPPPSSPGSSSSSVPASAARPAGGYPARGPAERTPLPPSSSSASPASGAPGASTSGSASISTSASSGAGGAPGGPRVRFGTSGGPPTAAPEAPAVSPAELAKIRELMQQQKWPEARDALQILLLRTPADRTNLAQLAYVRAREALELGNLSEARRELVRALAIEPTLEPAKKTLAEINSPINSPVPRR